MTTKVNVTHTEIITDKFYFMCKKQNDFELSIDEQWLSRGWGIDTALQVEVGEVLNLLNYKWWTEPKEIDWDSVRMELVDVWHFVLAKVLIIDSKDPKFIDRTSVLLCEAVLAGFKPYAVKDAAGLCAVITNWQGFACSGLLNIVEFVRICSACELPFDMLYKQYMAKNKLNAFRQRNGYSTGEYKKVWNGQEDSKVVYELVKAGIDLFSLDYELTWRYSLVTS